MSPRPVVPVFVVEPLRLIVALPAEAELSNCAPENSLRLIVAEPALELFRKLMLGALKEPLANWPVRLKIAEPALVEFRKLMTPLGPAVTVPRPELSALENVRLEKTPAMLTLPTILPVWVASPIWTVPFEIVVPPV